MTYGIYTLPKVSLESQVKLKSSDNDSIIILNSSGPADLTGLYGEFTQLDCDLRKLAVRDAKVANDVSIHFVAGDKPMVLSPLGRLDRDYDDVRVYADAAGKAIKRLRACGPQYKAPLVLVEPPKGCLLEPERYAKFLEVSMLAVLAELDDCIEVRESGRFQAPIESLKFAVLGNEGFSVEGVLQNVLAIESGRRLARDIGGSDPERMAPLQCAAAIEDHFKGSCIKVEVLKDHEVLAKEHPLFMAVARASLSVPRHHPCIVKLVYKSPEPSQVKEELFMVGKGVTFDTGGADLKVGGHMVGMSRDKCGAAGLAGFMASIAALAPKNVNVTVELAFVRNSIGANAYVCDEIITSRAGVRVRIGNTDAEGRMAMGDLLAEVKEMTLSLPDPSKARLFTCATLTGHVVRAYGPYAAAMDNGPAKRVRVGPRIKDAGELIGDPFELSTIRREDFAFVAPTGPREDIVQANSAPSTMTNRGHQYPFAFLCIASGLDKHGNDSECPIAYTHLDIAGAAEESGIGGLGRPTGCPVAALTAAFL